MDDDSLMAETRKWREKKSLPLKMVLSEYDYELLIDWEENQSVKAFFSVVKNRDIIKLKEFIYDQENSVVKDMAGNPYPNECIIVFYKKK